MNVQRLVAQPSLKKGDIAELDVVDPHHGFVTRRYKLLENPSSVDGTAAVEPLPLQLGYVYFPEFSGGKGLVLSGTRSGPKVKANTVGSSMSDLGLGYNNSELAFQALVQRLALVRLIREKQDIESNLDVERATFKSTTQKKWTVRFNHEHNEIQVVQNNKNQYSEIYWMSTDKSVWTTLIETHADDIVAALGVTITTRRKRKAISEGGVK